MLGVEAGEEGESSVEEWVKEHQELLEGPYDYVTWQLESRRQLRDQSHESKVTDMGIEEGVLVYTHNHAMKGRNNIQDMWDSTLYRVLQQPKEWGARLLHCSSESGWPSMAGT